MANDSGIKRFWAKKTKAIAASLAVIISTKDPSGH
jgi:hypothetical protein